MKKKNQTNCASQVNLSVSSLNCDIAVSAETSANLVVLLSTVLKSE